MLNFICMVSAKRWATGSKRKIQMKYVLPPGIKPATPCFPACRSNHSAIETVNDFGGSIPGGGIHIFILNFRLTSHCSHFGEAYTNEIKHDSHQSKRRKEIDLILNKYGDGLIMITCQPKNWIIVFIGEKKCNGSLVFVAQKIKIFYKYLWYRKLRFLLGFTVDGEGWWALHFPIYLELYIPPFHRFATTIFYPTFANSI